MAGHVHYRVDQQAGTVDEVGCADHLDLHPLDDAGPGPGAARQSWAVAVPDGEWDDFMRALPSAVPEDDERADRLIWLTAYPAGRWPPPGSPAWDAVPADVLAAVEARLAAGARPATITVSLLGIVR